MKKSMLIAALLAAAAGQAMADTSVNGYVRQDGTYVAPHYKSSPNSTTRDNYSTRGNSNPYTGKSGTEKPNDGAVYGAPAAPRETGRRY